MKEQQIVLKSLVHPAEKCFEPYSRSEFDPSPAQSSSISILLGGRAMSMGCIHSQNHSQCKGNDIYFHFMRNDDDEVLCGSPIFGFAFENGFQLILK